MADEQNPTPSGGHSGKRHAEVDIHAGHANLKADLHVPANVHGTVLFAHGSGSSRHSPRNRYVAQMLQQRGLATLLLDLLTEAEESLDERTGHLRFDVELLARRLVDATRWAMRQAELVNKKMGYFGASTGAAAALLGAAQVPEIAAVVSRGGRPDLAGPALDRVAAPVLLIVGGEDHTVLNLNRQAMTRLNGEKKLEIVPGATHLFEERGALDEVARKAAEWFDRWLGPS